MLSTLCQSAAPGRILVPWAGKVPEFFGMIVETILMILEIVCRTLHEQGAFCRKAGRRLMALRPGLSHPMMPKLETRDRHARLPGLQPPNSRARLMVILVPPRLNDAAGCVLLADIGAEPARITNKRRPDLDVSLSAPRYLGQSHGFRRASTQYTGSEQLPFRDVRFKAKKPHWCRSKVFADL